MVELQPRAALVDWRDGREAHQVRHIFRVHFQPRAASFNWGNRREAHLVSGSGAGVQSIPFADATVSTVAAVVDSVSER